MTRSVRMLLSEHSEIKYEAGFRGEQFGIWYSIDGFGFRAFGIIEGPDLVPELSGPPAKYQINAILTVLRIYEDYGRRAKG